MRADFVLPRKYPICAIDTHVGNDEDYQLCIKSMQGDSNIVQVSIFLHCLLDISGIIILILWSNNLSSNNYL